MNYISCRAFDKRKTPVLLWKFCLGFCPLLWDIKNSESRTHYPYKVVIKSLSSMAQSVARSTEDEEVPGSNHGRNYFLRFYSRHKLSDHECTCFYVICTDASWFRMLRIFYCASRRNFHQPSSTWPTYNTLSLETWYLLIIHEVIHVFEMSFLRVPKGYDELFYILLSNDLWIMFELTIFWVYLFKFALV
jgi:hypothetical protein